MHNKVAFQAAKAAVQLGLPALRFNFRGAGQSEGEFADGIGEQNDARAALEYLETRFPEIPICVMGFSFGAWVGMSIGGEDPRVVALVGLGVPAAIMDFKFLLDVRKPKLIVQGTRDMYGPRAEIEALFNSMPNPKQLRWVEGTDHFFAGHLDDAQLAVRGFLEEIIRSML